MEIENLKPELRFPEFEDNWKTKQLGDIASFRKGKGVSKADIHFDGKLECIRYGELYTQYKEVINEVFSRTNVPEKELVLSEANDVIIPASGETQIDIATASCVLRSGIALGGDLNIIKSPLDGVFLSYYLNNTKKNQIASLAQGISVVHLYANQLKTITLSIPSLIEQQKIASFIIKIEICIQLLNKKKDSLKEYKKGMMQKIFSQEIRFKDKNGDDFPEWEEKRIGDLLSYLQPTKFLVSSTDYDDKYDIPVLTAGKTFILGYTNEKTGIFKDKLPTIIFDDFTTSFKFVDFPFKAKSSAMKMLIANNSDLNIKFLYEAMKTIQFPVSEHKRYWISEYQNQKIPYPTLAEQQKIVSFLSSLDKHLEHINSKIERTIVFKKGLLQKMFV